MSTPLGPHELAALEAQVDHALRTGDESALDVLGYGEISCVLAVHGDEVSWVAKRLPLFDSEERLADYGRCLEAYLEELATGGVVVAESMLLSTPAADGRVAAWCFQPLLDADRLAPAWLKETADEEGARWLFGHLADRVLGCVTDRLGLDGQLSNWVVGKGDDHLLYTDVTTPMLRDEHGADRLDTDLFISSLPWALRGIVRHFLLSSILDKYYRPREILRDLLANLIKEGADRWMGPGLEVYSERVDPPLTEDEVRSYYQSDARMWAVLQWLRRVDRFWQRRVRGRPYPFLLPGSMERHV